MSTLSTIQTKIARLEAQVGKLRAQAAAEREKLVATVIRDARAKVAEYGITARDLGFDRGTAAKSKPRKAVSLKMGKGQVFRSLNGETWIGGTRGPKPRWLREALEDGKELSQFAVT